MSSRAPRRGARPVPTAVRALLAAAAGLVLSGAAGCRGVLGIEEKGCNRCVNGTQRLVCNGNDAPHAEACPHACHEGSCVASVVSLSATHAHVCAARSDGTVWCWGDNSNGQLGGTLASGSGLSTTPVKVTVPESTSVAAGALHSCAVTASGEVYCWGSDVAQQSSGVSSNPQPIGPTKVPLPPGVAVRSVTGGGAHTCALATNGDVYCWGANYLGQCGADPGWTASPVPPPACPATIDDIIGANGLNPRTTFSAPRLVLSGASSVLAMKHTTCALTANGLLCWGSNCSTASDLYGLCCDHGGELGAPAGSPRYVATPAAVPGLDRLSAGSPPFALGYGSLYAIATTVNGTRVVALGSNENGQLGAPPGDAGSGVPDAIVPLAIKLPVPPHGLFSSEGSDACARVTGAGGEDRLYCWGQNDCGELGTSGACGDGTPLPPTELTFTGGSASDLDLSTLVRGDDFGCAVKKTEPDTVVCWGDTNAYGTASCSPATCSSVLVPVLTTEVGTDAG